MDGLPADRHLAQVNIATLRHPLDDPRVAEFVDNLDLVNGLGERSPGFVWRLQTPAGDATAVQVFDNPLTIINLTLWESLEALRGFAYRGTHRQFFQRRREWFEEDGSATALWWMPIGAVPDEHDARRHVDFLARHGSSPYAFEIGAREPAVVIGRTDIETPAARALIAGLDQELTERYPEPGSNFFHLGTEQVAAGNGLFLTAALDGAAVACGAYRKLDPATAEVERMYVAPAARGLKLGAAILSELEGAATRDGVTRMVLETGPAQPEAIGLYERFGYTRIPCWGEYACAPASVCYERLL